MDENVNNDNVNENMGATEFPQSHTYGKDAPGYRGRFSAFWQNFGLGGKKKRGRPKTVQPLAGDAKTPAEETFADFAGGYGRQGTNYAMPRVEQERRRRYQDYERMDQEAEVGAALDIYSDDATQENTKSELFELSTDNDVLKREVEQFLKQTKLDKYIWDIVRNVAKYGDCFVENVVDLNNIHMGIRRLKILNPNFVFRVEDKYGYLKEFLQEIPNPQNQTSDLNQSFIPDKKKKNFITLNKDQIVHFRRMTSDANYYPYGKGILAYGVRVFKSLMLMEDAMLIYRIQRAPERRAFYLETGNLPQSKVEAFVERIKAKFKKQPMWNNQRNSVDYNYNPLTVDEDFFIPIRNGQGTKVEVLPGAQNLGETDDVKYFRDKLLAALKVPKDFIVEKDNSPERKANLSQLDVKFAKAVHRLQADVERSLNVLLKRHLTLRELPKSLVESVEISLTSPSDMFEKRRLEVDEQKVRIVQAVKGLMLFDDEYLYKTYFGMTDAEVEDMKERMKKQQEENPQPDPMGMAAPMPPMGGLSNGADPGVEEAGEEELDADSASGQAPEGTTSIGQPGDVKS